MERKAAKDAEEVFLDEMSNHVSEGIISEAPLDSTNNFENGKKPNPLVGRSASINSEESAKQSKKGFFSKFRTSKEAKSPGKRSASALESFDENAAENGNQTREDEDRPAFSSMIHGSSSLSKKMEPRAVAIPYSRLKKDRFFDWPPDPTVSRATPMDIYPEAMEDIDSLTASVPDVAIPDQEDDFPSTLRRRHVSDNPIPTNISF